MSTNEKYDAIVVGAGHNGLVHACYLAKAGLNTCCSSGGSSGRCRHYGGGYPVSSSRHSLRDSLGDPRLCDLDLVRHGMMVLPMVKTFQPGLNGNTCSSGLRRCEYHEIAHIFADAGLPRSRSHHSSASEALKPWVDRFTKQLERGPADIAEMAELRGA